MGRNGEPLHMTISAELKARIIAGELNPGDMLSSENELAQQYQTSRVTVRKSLQTLENQGLVYAYQGKGYFVSKPSHNNFSIDFAEDERGFEVSYRDINVGYPTAEVSEALDLAPNQLVIDIFRLIRKRGTPVALDVKYLPYDKGIPTLEEELQYAVFPEIVSKQAPFAIQTKMEIAAELPSPEVARQLDCPADRPLLVVYRWLFDYDERRMGYGKKYMLPEYGRLHAKSGYEL